MALELVLEEKRSRMLARRFAAERGQTLQREFPEIADQYRGGKTLRELVGEYAIIERFGLEPEQETLAINIVYRALAGNSYPEPSYQGLIPPRELRRIGKAHIKRTARANGKRVQELGAGIFAAPAEDRRRWSQAAGKIGGARVKELGVGYCGLSDEERKDASRKGIEALGLTPWEREELAIAYLLSRRKLYRDTRSGCGVRHRKVAETLNALLYDGESVRTGNSVAAMWRRQEAALQEIREDTGYLAKIREQYFR